MSAVELAGDKIVRHLQEAVERLHEDIARVELWAGALGCFQKPVPEYNAAENNLNKYILPPAKRKAGQQFVKQESDRAWKAVRSGRKKPC